MYKHGLSLDELGSFTGHDGFDGAMPGSRDGWFHFEFTCCHHHSVRPAPTPEDLLVFYVPDIQDWEDRCMQMREAGFTETESFNPYRSDSGCTVRDQDGYRVVIQRSAWSDKS